MPDGSTLPRLMPGPALRAYLGGLTAAELRQRVAEGRLPKPLWGLEADDKRARWDRAAVDRALDRASGLPANDALGTSALDRALGLR